MHDRRKIVRNILFLAIVLQAFVLMIPLFYMLSTSFKLPSEVFDLPIRWIPEQLHFENYIQPLHEKPFLRWMFNSTFVATIVTILNVLTSALAGYSFAKFSYPGRDLLFGFILATFMIPLEAMIVPLFVLVKDLGWLNSYVGLIIPAGGSAFGIFMMRQHMLAMPDELIEAARIDGASEFGIFWKIMLPLAKPPLITVGIFTFLGSWNDFFGPLIYLNSPDKFTVAVGLATFRSVLATRWELLMAASTAMIVPVIILFFFAQRYFIKGIVMTGLKG